VTVDVRVEATIDRPLHEVAAFAADPSNAPRWYRRIDRADWRTDAPVRVGSRIAFRARFLGRNLEYTYEVTDYVPGERLTMTTAQGPFPMTTEYTWSRLVSSVAGDGSTLMTLRNHGRPTGFSKLTAPMMSRAMRRAMTQDLRLLKQLLEQH
jgi:uncharacterized protein YndB with AHSA1/START domain